MSATKVNKPAINKLLKGMGLNPRHLTIVKNNYWTIKNGLCVTNDWNQIHDTICQGLASQDIRFCDYGHAIQVYL